MFTIVVISHINAPRQLTLLRKVIHIVKPVISQLFLLTKTPTGGLGALNYIYRRCELQRSICIS